MKVGTTENARTVRPARPVRPHRCTCVDTFVNTAARTQEHQSITYVVLVVVRTVKVDNLCRNASARLSQSTHTGTDQIEGLDIKPARSHRGRNQNGDVALLEVKNVAVTIVL